MSPSFVCSCNFVTEQEIKRVIEKRKITSLKELIMASGAGHSCGRCRLQVKEILESCLVKNDIEQNVNS